MSLERAYLGCRNCAYSFVPNNPLDEKTKLYAMSRGWDVIQSVMQALEEEITHLERRYAAHNDLDQVDSLPRKRYDAAKQALQACVSCHATAQGSVSRILESLVQPAVPEKTALGAETAGEKAPESPSQKKTYSDFEMDSFLDTAPAEGGAHKRFDQWQEYWSRIGRDFAALPDYYLAGKSGNKVLLENIKADLKCAEILANTKIQYDTLGERGRIIHHSGSHLFRTKSYELRIPDYYNNTFGISLPSILSDLSGLSFMQALLGTEDDPETIKQTLYQLSGYDANRTRIVTRSFSSRGHYPYCLVDLNTSVRNFFIRGVFSEDPKTGLFGHTRGLLSAESGVK